MLPTPAKMKQFLEEDLSHALKELFVGAVAWDAGRKSELCPFQKDLGMYASFVQARALYEFFYSCKRKKPKQGKNKDDARACDFVTTVKWSEKRPKSNFYSQYMENDTPANKRVFHLVYGRSSHAVINDQVLVFAQELLMVTREFRDRVDSDFVGSVECALQKALRAAREAVTDYNIDNNPLA
jgi:hypothetical protein